MGKIIVCKASELPSGKMQKVAADGKEILVANINGSLYAMDDTCTHAGASLSEGTIEGCNVVCGWHGAKFDCTSGKLSAFPAKIKDLRSYKVVQESDNIFLEV